MTNMYIPTAIAFCLFASSPAAPSVGSGDRPAAKAEALASALSVLQKSQKPEELESAANSLANMRSGEATKLLTGFLEDPGFVRRLDSDADYKYHLFDLRVGHVLTTMAKASTPETQQAFLDLLNSKEFRLNSVRPVLLINACEFIHKPRPELLSQLDHLADQPGGYVDTVCHALAQMRKPEASALIEARIRSARYSTATKKSWFTEFLITVRDDSAILPIYRHLLESGNKDDELINMAVLSLFDYRRREWYPIDYPAPSPPDRHQASSEALQELLKIADIALVVRLPADTRQAVEAERAAIVKILAGR